MAQPPLLTWIVHFLWLLVIIILLLHFLLIFLNCFTSFLIRQILQMNNQTFTQILLRNYQPLAFNKLFHVHICGMSTLTWPLHDPIVFYIFGLYFFSMLTQPIKHWDYKCLPHQFWKLYTETSLCLQWNSYWIWYFFSSKIIHLQIMDIWH